MLCLEINGLRVRDLILIQKASIFDILISWVKILGHF